MCECKEKVDVKLVQFNTRLVSPYVLVDGASSKPVVIATEKINTRQRGKVRTLFATFCPFCGVKL